MSGEPLADFLQPITLSGELVTLEPLSPEHHDGLVDAARDGELWNLWYTLVPAPEAMRAEITRRLALQAAAAMLPFTARRNDTARIIGMTTYMNVDADNRRVEIGRPGTRTPRSAPGRTPRASCCSPMRSSGCSALRWSSAPTG